jgi:hypothetical protein
MKKLSEQFLKMSQRTAALENRAAVRNEENRKEFEADVAEARQAVQSAQASFETKLNSIEESVSSQWHKLEESFNNQVAAAQSKAADRKAAHNLADVKERADYYEAYAEVAAEFANLAAIEAEAAMLQATEARAHANSLEKMTV